MDTETSASLTTTAIASISKQAYQDLVHPAATEIGKTLGYAGRLFSSVFKGLDVASIHIEQKWDSFVKKAEATVDTIPPNRKIAPSLGVFQPIATGAWCALDSDILQDMFLCLLKTSMDSHTASKALPVYGEIIRQICPDEALLLTVFHNHPGCHPILNILAVSASYTARFRTIKEKLTLLPSNTKLQYANNISIYLENLSRLGIIDIDFSKQASDQRVYDRIEQLPEVLQTKKEIENDTSVECEYEYGTMTLTNFGKAFCDACITVKGQTEFTP